MSEANVNRFADQPWWPAAATLTSATASHIFPPVRATNITGVTASAQINIAVLRAAFSFQPRFSNAEEIQPPPIDPIVEA